VTAVTSFESRHVGTLTSQTSAHAVDSPVVCSRRPRRQLNAHPTADAVALNPPHDTRKRRQRRIQRLARTPHARRRQQHRTAYVGCSTVGFLRCGRWLSPLLEGSRVARSIHLREKWKSRSRSSGSVTSLARRAHSPAYSRHFVSVLMLGCSEGDGWPTAAKGCSSWVPARAAQGRPHTRDWEPRNHDGMHNLMIIAAPHRPTAPCMCITPRPRSARAGPARA
jgi:hypothetical protein